MVVITKVAVGKRGPYRATTDLQVLQFLWAVWIKNPKCKKQETREASQLQNKGASCSVQMSVTANKSYFKGKSGW